MLAQQTAEPTHPTLRLGAIEISGVSLPAGSEGGDLLGTRPAGNGCLSLYVADVIGKGSPAATLKSKLKTALQAASRDGGEPGRVCNRFNRSLCGEFSGGQFATAFYARLDPLRRRLLYTRAGHGPALLVRRDGTLVRLLEGGGLLGAFRRWRYEQGEIELREGDRLLLYTDGLTEAASPDGQHLGEERVASLLQGHRHLDAQSLLEKLMTFVARFTDGHLHDDMTLSVVAVDGLEPEVACA